MKKVRTQKTELDWAHPWIGQREARRYIRKALKADIERWTTPTRHYESGRNPWTEVFTESVTEVIGGKIGVTDHDTLLQLRKLLAFTADDVGSIFNFVGGHATGQAKRNWRVRTIKTGKKFHALLRRADNYTSLAQEGSSRYSVGKMQAKCAATEKVVSDLISFLVSVDDAELKKLAKKEVRVADDLDPHEPGRLLASDKAQYAVDRLTAVFVNFCGVDEAKRKNNDGGGTFSDFVRASALPIFEIHFESFTAGKGKSLRAHIQMAIRRIHMP